MEAYYVIRDLVSGGYWDSFEARFRGIHFAYKMSINTEIALDAEFQLARAKSSRGVEIVKVYK